MNSWYQEESGQLQEFNSEKLKLLYGPAADLRGALRRPGIEPWKEREE
jgi:hypothetical protein